jgi:2-polyprenyl-3-methyl-5-hydroxy-6-metoxy-1,4-benzoquinol methylase
MAGEPHGPPQAAPRFPRPFPVDSMRSPSHYRTHAQAYFDATQGVDMAPLYARFTPLLPPGARVLDAGCGSGRDALAFQRMGFAVEAEDALNGEPVVRHQQRQPPM